MAANLNLKQRRCTRSCDSGFTVVEMLVATLMALVVLGMTTTVSIANRDAYGFDVVRTRMNQNIRGAFTILASEIRQAGERLPASFPAIEVIDGTGTDWDQIIVRRNLLDEVVTLCDALPANGTGPNLMMSNNGGGYPPACSFGSQTAAYNSWRTRRLAQNPQQNLLMIYDFSTRLGEFITHTSETNNTSGSRMYLTRTPPNGLANAYTVGTAGNTALYVIHEWRFRRSTTAGQTDSLEIVENGSTVLPLTFGVTNFGIRVTMQDGTVRTTFNRSENWTLIRNIEITISAASTYRSRPVTTTLVTNLLPRNVLSN